MQKKILIRADASETIGTGHVMRCISLAKKAKDNKWEPCFVLRDPSQSIIELLKFFEIPLKILKTENQIDKKIEQRLQHASWLPVNQELDAMQTLDIINEFKPNCVVVDHYSLDAFWHKLVSEGCKTTLVIDDLGDRHLIGDLVLDQNIGASAEKYEGKIYGSYKLLLGPRFALLRDEFSKWREHSMKDRFEKKIENILITMGGVDFENYTLEIMKELIKSKHAENCKFTIIVGRSYPYLNSLKVFTEESKLKIRVFSDVKNMAKIMSNSDLCIGAAGSTSWERCCLGLPTITFAIANNQKEIAKQLHKCDVSVFSNIAKLRDDFDQFFGSHGPYLKRTLASNSSELCDGYGAFRVVKELEKTIEN